DGDGFQLAKGARHLLRAARPRDPSRDGIEGFAQFGHVPAKSFANRVRSEHEDPRVPEKLSRTHVLLRGLRLGLFHESLDLSAFGCKRLADLDVAEAGLGTGGANSDRHQISALRKAGGSGQIVPKGSGVANRVIRGEHREDALRIPALNVEG